MDVMMNQTSLQVGQRPRTVVREITVPTFVGFAPGID